jgi:hypothetical protein
VACVGEHARRGGNLSRERRALRSGDGDCEQEQSGRQPKDGMQLSSIQTFHLSSDFFFDGRKKVLQDCEGALCCTNRLLALPAVTVRSNPESALVKEMACCGEVNHVTSLCCTFISVGLASTPIAFVNSRNASLCYLDVKANMHDPEGSQS